MFTKLSFISCCLAMSSLWGCRFYNTCEGYDCETTDTYYENYTSQEVFCDQQSCYECDDWGCYDVTCFDDRDCPETTQCGSSNVCQINPTPYGCQADNDCWQSEFCGSNGYCYQNKDVCQNDGECLEDEVCTSEFVCRKLAIVTTVEDPTAACETGDDASAKPSDCNEPSDTTPLCTESANCEDGQQCINGACIAKESSGGPYCQFDNQCGYGGVCFNGECHAKCESNPMICPSGEDCVDGICRYNPAETAECLYDTDCAVDIDENGETGLSEICINRHCLARCENDLSCGGEWETCQQGACQPDFFPKAECALNSECSDGFQCVNATCMKPCQEDSACGENGMCDTGYCFYPPEVEPECLFNVDCGDAASNQVCLNATCEVLEAP